MLVAVRHPAPLMIFEESISYFLQQHLLVFGFANSERRVTGALEHFRRCKSDWLA
jgi:hypothetical protein